MRRLVSVGSVLIVWMILPYRAQAQIVSSTPDPEKAKIVYDDIVNFNRAFKMLESTDDTVGVLQKEYIDKGTPGLRIFIEKYDLTADKLRTAISKHPGDYRAIPDKMQWLKSQEDSIRAYFKKTTRFIPGVVFPPTWYLVDIRRGIGSGSVEGQLVTIEKEAVKVVDPGLKAHVIHELVHLNQLNAIGSLEKYLAIYNDEKSLLAITLREGIAEFFADLITGELTQEPASSFTRIHERELWERFRGEMYGKETGDWMWEDPADPEQPRDVGYVLGSFIVGHYYKRATDIDRATSELLSLTDYRKFMEKCGYWEKFSD